MLEPHTHAVKAHYRRILSVTSPFCRGCGGHLAESSTIFTFRPVSRKLQPCPGSSEKEHLLSMQEVGGSIPSLGPTSLGSLASRRQYLQEAQAPNREQGACTFSL